MSPLTFNSFLVAAHTKALETLVKLLETADDPKEIRLIASAILRMKPLSIDAESEAEVLPDSGSPTTQTDTAPKQPLSNPANAPLTADELDALARLLPSVRRERFTAKHTPAYWRDVLTRNTRQAAKAA